MSDDCEMCDGAGEIDVPKLDEYGNVPCPDCVSRELNEKIAELRQRATAEAFIAHVSTLAAQIAAQSGTASSELVGQIVSVLARDPTLIDRFMRDGSEMFLEGAFAPERGVLSWYGQNGQIVTPEFMRAYLRDKQPTRVSGLDENH